MFPVACIPHGSPSAPFVGALDALTTNLAGVWWISSRLLSSYSGSLIRVRRSSDYAESDIGYTATGSLDTTALLAFCGAGDGFLVKIYSQTGGTDAVQSTAASQLRVVSSGSVVTSGGFSAADNSTHSAFISLPVFSGAAGTFYWRQQNSGTNSSPVVSDLGSAGTENYWPFVDGDIYTEIGSNARKSCGLPGVDLSTSMVNTCVTAASNWILRLNKAAYFSTATNTVGWGSSPRLGKGFGGVVSYGFLHGLIWYNVAHTSTNWNQIEPLL